MTERQETVLRILKDAGEATVEEMIRWLDCPRRDATLCLGIMVRCQQLFRVGWRGVENVSVWSWKRPGE